jgi:hypothetical protein
MQKSIIQVLKIRQMLVPVKNSLCGKNKTRLCNAFNSKELSVNGAKRSERADFVEQSDRKSLCGS